MKLQPMYDQVLVRRNDSNTVSRGGIVIPDNAQEKSAEGEVMAVGPGKLLETGSLAPIPFLQPGNRVLFNKYAGVDTTIDGEKYVLIRGDDILGVFRER